MDANVHILATVYDDGNGKGSSYGDGVPFVIAGPLTLSSNAYDYGSVPVSNLELDAGYNGYVLFETRWYGTGDSYRDYASSCVIVNVDTTGCGRR
jgi:hypothetical protein